MIFAVRDPLRPIPGIAFVLLFLFAVAASTAGSSAAWSAPLPAAPQLSAKSYVLLDDASGETLASKEPDARVEPASLTKIMTAYIVAGELARGSVTLDEPVIVSEQAQSMPGSRMFIEAGKTVVLADLLRGLIIQSGNDASVALAEHIAASERGFVDMMNRTAETLGMQGTSYANSSGLPHPDHYTTANDLGIIARAMIRDHPEIYAIYSEREFTFNEITQKNRNTLLWRDETVDGMKTGHTEAAGYCLVASARRDNMRLITIVLGTASEKTRLAESERLLNYGFRFFRSERIYAAGEAVTDARIWMGQQDTIALGVGEDLWLTLPRDDFAALETKIEISDYIRAPVGIGEELGRSVLTTSAGTVREVSLLALQKIDEGGIFKRMQHSIQRHFQ